ncbi:MAG: TVP38/TMEM64 family protein [Verrucomicrobiota bacterium]
MNAGHANEATSTKGRWLLWLALLVAVVVAIKFLPVQDWLKQALDVVERLGPLGPVLFILVYIAACVLLIPGSVLTLGIAAVYGVAKGFLIVSIASTLGATVAFLVGRHLARRWVAQKLAGNDKFAAIDRAVAREGWKIVGLTRLSPIFPFTLLNYAFGLTSVSLRDYVLASWLGMMPGTLLYVYIGSLAQAGTRQRTPAEWALYAVGLLATIAVTLYVTRLAKRALTEKIT